MKTFTQQTSIQLIRLFTLFLLSALLMQCIGPEGPMGPQGNDGRDGINYTNSVIYDVQPQDWSGDINGYTAVLNVPEITNDIYYNGALLVYRLIETEPKSFNLLPYTYVDNGLMIYMDFDAYIGSINLMYKKVDNGVNDTPAPSVLMSFKVVLIEGIPLATLKNMVNVNDFAAVSSFLHLKDRTGSMIQ